MRLNGNVRVDEEVKETVAQELQALVRWQSRVEMARMRERFEGKVRH